MAATLYRQIFHVRARERADRAVSVKRGRAISASSSKPDLWDRKVYIVSRSQPSPSVLAVHDIELDRESHISRPMTHIVGFYDKQLANVTKRMAPEDWKNGEDDRWVLDDDNVDMFLCARMEEFLESDACRVEGDTEFTVQKMTFDDLQRWAGMSGMVLRMVERVDSGAQKHLVVTSHYPREEAMFYLPYLGVCWNI
eukprot:jgi/Mesvir1/14632/Mv05302-RA.1